MRKKLLLKRFGIAVRNRRIELGLTQLKLAELAGVSWQAISNIERGNANPSLYMIYRIAYALMIGAKDLIP